MPKIGEKQAKALKDITVKIHWSFFVGLITVGVSIYFANRSLSEALIWTIGVYGSILLHELAHCYIAVKLNVEIKKVIFHFFGASAEPGEMSSWKEGIISLSGPLCSLILCFVLLHIYDPLAGFNFIFAVFNLFPGYPLDGGRALKAGLSYFLSPYASLYIALLPLILLICGLMVIAVFYVGKGDMLVGVKLGALSSFLNLYLMSEKDALKKLWLERREGLKVAH